MGRRSALALTQIVNATGLLDHLPKYLHLAAGPSGSAQKPAAVLNSRDFWLFATPGRSPGTCTSVSLAGSLERRDRRQTGLLQTRRRQSLRWGTPPDKPPFAATTTPSGGERSMGGRTGTQIPPDSIALPGNAWSRPGCRWRLPARPSLGWDSLRSLSGLQAHPLIVFAAQARAADLHL